MTNFIILSSDLIAEAGGYTIAGVGYIIVFISLIILVFIFATLPKLFTYFIKYKLRKETNEPNPTVVRMDTDVTAAISMAFHLYFTELHDEESNIITIKNAQKQYSPWSSKIYGMQNQPQR